jgi:hypothetical protein
MTADMVSLLNQPGCLLIAGELPGLRAVKSFPSNGRSRPKSTKLMNASSSIIYPMDLLTSIDLARPLRSIRPIRRVSAESNHLLHSTPRLWLARRVDRRWTIRRATKRSTVGASPTCLRPSMMRRSTPSAGRNPCRTCVPSPTQRRTYASMSQWEPKRILRSPRGAINNSGMPSKNYIGG